MGIKGATSLARRIEELDDGDFGTRRPRGRRMKSYERRGVCRRGLRGLVGILAVIRKNAACAVQAYRVGPWSYGIQYHPEWSRETILKEVADATPEELAAAGTTANDVRQATTEHAATAARQSERMFDLCNLVLFPTSQLQTGLAARSPLHH